MPNLTALSPSTTPWMSQSRRTAYMPSSPALIPPNGEVRRKNLSDRHNNPAGSNVGIIKFQSPYQSPQMVAATRAIPGGYIMSLLLTADGQYLYGVYPETPTDTGAGAVFVY